MSCETSSYHHNADEKIESFASGAVRAKSLRFDQIPPRALRRLAARYTLGTQKYPQDDGNNWKKGLLDPAYVKQFEAHLIAHWVEWKLNGNKDDDNLAAMAWGVFALMEAEEAQKEGEQMQPHQERVVQEKRELDEKLSKLRLFFTGPIFPTLDEAEQQRLNRQEYLMNEYSELLAERIGAF